jgi:hypothetical protein
MPRIAHEDLEPSGRGGGAEAILPRMNSAAVTRTERPEKPEKPEKPHL